MKIESITIQNFRCFGPTPVTINLQSQLTGFVGNNGSGKTALFQALSRLFGIASQRSVRREDFHVAVDQDGLQSGATLSIEVILAFPELDGDEIGNAVPEFFNQMAATEPGGPLKVRVRLIATWTDDGTPYGFINEDIRWIRTLGNDFEWEECLRVSAVDRGSIQLIYIPATRDVASQITSLLKGRLWKAAKWSENFRENSAESAKRIQTLFENEDSTKFILERLSKYWQQVHDADTDTTPALSLVESRLDELVRKAEFTFYPDEAGQKRAISDLSDGQRSLFHITLTAATLEAERDALALAPEDSVFEQEQLIREHLTLLAIEEPENSLSPFFLSRIIALARKISKLSTAQVALSSHSSAILSRLEPEEVRHFRLDSEMRQNSVRQIKLPTDDFEAKQYVRLAVRAYPELYFARFVILGEGDSERLIIPRIAEAMNVPLDPSFVSIVPLGGRYVGHFWSLLSDLGIPFATLLDFDLGRAHGGANIIRNITSKLMDNNHDLHQNSHVQSGEVDLDALDKLDNNVLFIDYEENSWLQTLKEEGVFFSYPLDVDFSMLCKFPGAYKQRRPGGRGPQSSKEIIKNKKGITLKTGGNPDLYNDDYDDEFKWYPYLFLNHGKPETHLAALSRISKEALDQHAPPELKALINYVKDQLGLLGDDE